MRVNKECKLETCVNVDNPRLSMPYADKENGVIVATDGRRMVIIEAEFEEGDVSSYIPKEALVSARKAAGKARQLTMTIGKLADGVQNEITVQGTRFIVPDVGQFPPWKAVLPDLKEQTPTVTLNAKYLFEIARGLAATDDKITLHIKDDRAVVAISVPGKIGNHAVLMPCLN